MLRLLKKRLYVMILLRINPLHILRERGKKKITILCSFFGGAYLDLCLKLDRQNFCISYIFNTSLLYQTIPSLKFDNCTVRYILNIYTGQNKK